MNDREFWDKYMSSMEDLTEEPPPEVKDAVFRRMERERRLKRWGKRIGSGLLALFIMGGGAYFIDPFADEPSMTHSSEGVHVWDPSIPGLGPGSEKVSPGKEKVGSREKKAGEKELLASKAGEGASSSREKQAEKNAPSATSKGGQDQGSERKIAQEKGSDASTIPSDASDEAKGEKEKTKELNLPKGEEKDEGVSRVSSSMNNKGSEKLAKLPERIPEAGSFDPERALPMDLELSKPLARASSPRFFLGTDLAFNFTRLIDERTMESFEETSLLSTDGNVYLDFSFTAGYNISDGTRLIGRYFMKKDVGQRYYEYVEGRYRARGLQLSYRSYELLLEQDLTSTDLSPDYQAALSAYGGGSLGVLRNAKLMEEGGAQDVQEGYKNKIFGLEGGFRVSVRSQAGLDLGLLMGASYSVSDVHSSEAQPRLTGGSSHTLSSGLGLSLRYHFGKKFRPASP